MISKINKKILYREALWTFLRGFGKGTGLFTAAKNLVYHGSLMSIGLLSKINGNLCWITLKYWNRCIRGRSGQSLGLLFSCQI